MEMNMQNTATSDSQSTYFVTVVEEVVNDDVPTASERQFLAQNGFARYGKVWKRYRRMPAKRIATAELPTVIQSMA
jgi:hypothetical protein